MALLSMLLPCSRTDPWMVAQSPSSPNDAHERANKSRSVPWPRRGWLRMGMEAGGMCGSRNFDVAVVRSWTWAAQHSRHFVRLEGARGRRQLHEFRPSTQGNRHGFHASNTCQCNLIFQAFSHGIDVTTTVASERSMVKREELAQRFI